MGYFERNRPGLNPSAMNVRESLREIMPEACQCSVWVVLWFKTRKANMEEHCQACNFSSYHWTLGQRYTRGWGEGRGGRGWSQAGRKVGQGGGWGGVNKVNENPYKHISVKRYSGVSNQSEFLNLFTGFKAAFCQFSHTFFFFFFFFFFKSCPLLLWGDGAIKQEDILLM